MVSDFFACSALTAAQHVSWNAVHRGQGLQEKKKQKKQKQEEVKEGGWI